MRLVHLAASDANGTKVHRHTHTSGTSVALFNTTLRLRYRVPQVSVFCRHNAKFIKWIAVQNTRTVEYWWIQDTWQLKLSDLSKRIYFDRCNVQTILDSAFGRGNDFRGCIVDHPTKMRKINRRCRIFSVWMIRYYVTLAEAVMAWEFGSMNFMPLCRRRSQIDRENRQQILS